MGLVFMAGAISIVKNPLTIIAMFAGIAEVSGTAVLPLITELNQRIYIFFLMFFPTFIVSIFFYTLLKKPESLYAPSDFVDEKNYMTIIGQQGISISLPSASNSEVNNIERNDHATHFKRINEEVNLCDADLKFEVSTSKSSESSVVNEEILQEPEVPYALKESVKPNPTSRKEMILKMLGSQAHYLAFLYAEHKLKIRFDLKKTEMRNELGYHKFDGAYYPPISNGKLTGDIVFLEIKVINLFRYQGVLKQVELINESWTHLKNIRVFFVLVIDGVGVGGNDLLNKEIEIIHKKAKFPVEVDVVTIDELKFNYEKK